MVNEAIIDLNIRRSSSPIIYFDFQLVSAWFLLKGSDSISYFYKLVNNSV